MSTDSTELTFVRCPSCRSLVPAVSTRCRMCGAGLDASAQAKPEDEESKKSNAAAGRVRQHTVTQSSSETGALRSELETQNSEKKADGPSESGGFFDTNEETTVEEAPASSSASGTSTDSSMDDPLGAYIEEIEVEEKANGARKSSEEKSSPEASGTEDSNQKPKVIVETGPRRSGKGLSFGGGAHSKGEEAKEKDSGKGASPLRALEGGQETKAHEKEGGWRPLGKEKEVSRKEQHDSRQENRKGSGDNRGAQPQRDGGGQRDQGKFGKGGHDNRQHQQGGGRHEQQPRGGNMPRKEERGYEERTTGDERRLDERTGSGKLFGWLVSYRSARGEALELREGRFFITSSSLKESDLVLDHRSVSTPHALAGVSLSDGFRVQDLMSEHGVWIKKKGSDSYQKIGESARFEHGDWIRIGEVEFLVSLVAR